MKIEAVTVCVQYSDFLAHTIIHNKPCFDKWVIVTHPDDRATRDLCEHYYVDCVTTTAMFDGGKSFDKGAAINAGLESLSRTDWLCHIDADIALPQRSRMLMEQAGLNPYAIYGIDRLMCPSFDDWQAYLSSPEVQHSCNAFVQANAFPLGVRISKTLESGYIPIGFFQLWNAASTQLSYMGHSTANRGDVLFAQLWPRSMRALIPEIFGIHLSSDDPNNMGTNWRGRSSPPFGPARPPCPIKPPTYSM